jgi:hypothetical protein
MEKQIPIYFFQIPDRSVYYRLDMQILEYSNVTDDERPFERNVESYV